VDLDKVYNYHQLGKKREHNDTLKKIHLTLESMKRELERVNMDSNGESMMNMSHFLHNQSIKTHMNRLA